MKSISVDTGCFHIWALRLVAKNYVILCGFKTAAIDLMGRGPTGSRARQPSFGPRLSGRTMSGMPKRGGQVVAFLVARG